MEGTRRAVSTWLSFAFAQQTQAPKRVGLMANLPLPPVLRFRERLQKLSWVEGKNLLVEYRYGEGRNDHFPNLRQSLCRCQWMSSLFGEAPRHLSPSAPPVVGGDFTIGVQINPNNRFSRRTKPIML